MKFKVDENLPVEVATLLRQNGYDTVTVLEQELGGKPDPDIALACQQESRALITIDTDFADIRAYPPRQFAGLIVLRLKRQDKLSVVNVLSRLIPVLSSEPLDGYLWIVEENRIRVRG